MNVRYQVELNQAERSELAALLSGGKHAARKLKRAQILLAADAGASDENIATSVGVGGSTVYRLSNALSAISASKTNPSMSGGTPTVSKR
jgi:transposase